MTVGHRPLLPLTVLLAVACNRPPNTPSVTLLPENPTTTATLIADATSTDPDGDMVDFTYAWFLDGELQPALTGREVGPDNTAKGGAWTVEVIATDGSGDSETGRASTTIVNTPPEGTVTIAPSGATSFDDITAVGDATDVDGDQVSWTWVWTRDGEPTGLTEATVTSNQLARGERWEVSGTPFDGEGSADPIVAAITIGNGVPVIESLTITPVPATAAGPLVAEHVTTDPDDDPLTFGFTWFVNGTAAIGASGDTLPNTLFARGDTVSVEATPNDGMTTGTPVTSDTVSVVNAIPTITGVAFTPAELRTASPIQCTPSGWDDGDGDPESYQFLWDVNGGDPGVTDGTLPADQFAKGDVVTCTVTPDDGFDQGTPLSTPPTEVLNSPPVLDFVELSDTTPSADQTLTLTFGDARDDDGDSIVFRYAWFVNGVEVADTETLDAGFFVAGDLIRCEVTPTDLSDDGTTVLTSEVEVGNTAPVVTGVTYDPETPDTTTPLTAVPAAVDIDGDELTYDFRWRVDGTPFLATTDAELPADAFARGQVVTLTVTANDGSADSEPLEAPSVTIGNAPPTLASAAIAPDVVTELTGVTCEPEGWDDPDGDTPDYQYTWTVDGVPQGVDAPTLSGDFFDKGNVVVCTATPFDGLDVGDPATSSPAQVQNAQPTIAGVLIDPAAPVEGDLLDPMVLGLADADPADTPVAFFEWFVDDVSVATTETLSSDLFARGDLVYVAVQPFDGEEFGAMVFSPEVLIANTAPEIRSVTVSPDPADTTTPLSAVVDAVDADDDDVVLAYRWFVDGVEVFGETSATLDASLFDKGDEVTVEVTPSDDADTGAAVVSEPREIRNSAPEAPVVRVAPRWAMAGVDDLVCEIVEPALDADGDNVTYEFQWERDGVAFTGATSTELPGDTISGADVGDGTEWTCAAAGVDAEDIGDPGFATANGLLFALRLPSAGDEYTCALDADSGIRCWGDAGQHDGMGSYPPGAFRQVSSGFATACAIDLADNLQCWGADTPLRTPPPGGFRQVSVASAHACAIGNNGVAQCWGENTSGQATPPVAIFREVSAGFLHSCGIDENDAIQCWGDGNFGQGDAPTEGIYDQIAAGGFFSCGLTRTGEVSCWGTMSGTVPEGTFLELDAGPLHACAIRADDSSVVCWGDDNAVDFTPPDGAFAKIAAGSLHTCGVRTDGEMVCWGEGGEGQTQPPNLALSEIDPGWRHTCAIDDTADVVCWGDDSDGQATVPALPGDALQVTAGGNHTCAIAGLFQAVCWGDPTSGKTAAPPSLFTVLDAGLDHTCGIASTGALSCWGDDTFGQATPPTSGVTPWAEVSSSDHHTCAIDDVGDLYCWGTNFSDELLVPPGSTWDSVAAGGFHTCGVRDDGELRCWGNDSQGQSTPPAGNTWVRVVAGTEHSCAMDELGAVTCWGNDDESRLDVPPGVFSTLEASADHTCGARDDGTTVCWGRFLF
jgi:alpha-tubulin suppressor-like RCC1 family protein